MTTGADRLLLDASVWVDSKVPDSPSYEASRMLVLDTVRPVGALALTLHEVANSLGVRMARAGEAVDMCRLIVGRCGPAIVSPDPMLMRSALSIAAENGIAAYDASYVAAAHREGWTLVSLDLKDLVSKGLAITPDAAV
ncbi:MAG: type II toxin-antitoxin system VapC family toxin [Actinobacteria bacterium]|nr:type II toxin-antitoxin system VapC family toxin [Actinomycetota bacterium]